MLYAWSAPATLGKPSMQRQRNSDMNWSESSNSSRASGSWLLVYFYHLVEVSARRRNRWSCISSYCSMYDRNNSFFETSFCNHVCYSEWKTSLPMTISFMYILMNNSETIRLWTSKRVDSCLVRSISRQIRFPKSTSCPATRVFQSYKRRRAHRTVMHISDRKYRSTGESRLPPL